LKIQRKNNLEGKEREKKIIGTFKIGMGGKNKIKTHFMDKMI
jgi:hypothetical protein